QLLIDGDERIAGLVQVLEGLVAQTQTEAQAVVEQRPVVFNVVGIGVNSERADNLIHALTDNLRNPRRNNATQERGARSNRLIEVIHPARVGAIIVRSVILAVKAHTQLMLIKQGEVVSHVE